MANFSAPLSTYKVALHLQNKEQAFIGKESYKKSYKKRKLASNQGQQRETRRFEQQQNCRARQEPVGNDLANWKYRFDLLWSASVTTGDPVPFTNAWFS